MQTIFLATFAWEKLLRNMRRDDHMQIPAIGRPFDLGTLYDARSDQIVAGPTLWNNDTLKDNVNKQENPRASIQILKNDSISEKTKALDINDELKFSFLAGLFPIDGSGKYLNDNFDKTTQERITFLYTSTTHWVKLGMDHLVSEKIEHHKTLNDNPATHVVTQIQYGADAFFIFDRQKTSKHDKKQISGSTGASFDKIAWKISAKGKVDHTALEDESSKQFSCKYYGDFIVPICPKDVKEAEELLKTIHEKLEKAVPKTIYLYPLAKLHPGAPKILANISTSWLEKTEEKLQAIIDACSALTSILNQPELKNFSALEREIFEYLKKVKSSERQLQIALRNILPRIRGGDKEQHEILPKVLGDGTENDLAKVLQIWEKSIFSREMMEEIVQDFKQELIWLNGHLDGLKRARMEIIIGSDQIYGKDSETPILALEFNIADHRGNLLELCTKFIGDPTTPFDQGQREHAWYNDETLRSKLHLNIERFITCAMSTNDSKGPVGLFLKSSRYVCRPSIPKTRKGKRPPELPISTVSYVNGTGTPIQLPYFEDGPEVNKVTSTSAELNWKQPKGDTDHITAILMLAKEVKGTGDYKTQAIVHRGEREETAMSVTVAKLEPQTEYSFRIRLATQWGLTPPSPASPIYATNMQTAESQPKKSSVNAVDTLNIEKLKLGKTTSSSLPEADVNNKTKEQQAKLEEKQEPPAPQEEQKKKKSVLRLCDECDDFIRGDVYRKCTVCANAFVCDTCANAGKHAMHPLVKSPTQEEKLKLPLAQKITTHPVLCEKCELLVRGIRYLCTVCPNYSLCSKCKEEGEHAWHPMSAL